MSPDRHARAMLPIRLGPTRCGWSSPTTVEDWPRAATSPRVLRRHSGRRRPGRSHPADGLLGRRDNRHRLRVGHHRHAYTTGSSRFTGKINWVQIDLGTDDHDHFIDPEERLRIAMARQ
jgi:hypothetical protein